MLLFIFLILVTGCYLGLIISLLFGWKYLPESVAENGNSTTRFSVVIPYRNEAENLSQLFQSLVLLKYPKDKFEIMLVNDASEDNSLELCGNFKRNHPEIKIVLLENKRSSASAKKDAIKTALEQSKFEFIVTTDADCILPENWLRGFDQEIAATNSKMIAGPVNFIAGTSGALYKKFDLLDFMSLQSTTIGAFGLGKPFMCNAANLCYEKKTFIECSGYAENEDFAGGDDVFLLQKFRKKGLKLSYLRSEDMIVETQQQQSLSAFVNQRIRWASKSTAYKSSFARFAALSVFGMNLCLIIYAFLALFGLFSFKTIMMVFLLKFNLDFVLIYKAARFFDREHIMRSYLWSSILYPFFSVIIALLSVFKGFKWKGRKFSK